MFNDRQPRVIVDEPVSLMLPTGPELAGRLRNLSQGGAFIVDLAAHPPVSSRIHLSFVLPGGAEVDTDATVLRAVTDASSEPEGIAVKFEDLDPEVLFPFIHEAVGPGMGASPTNDRVRLKLETQEVVITARCRGEERGALLVECDLPFLCIGTGVQLQHGPGGALRSGTLAWVSTQVPPGSPYPRIHLGIALDEGHKDVTPSLCSPTRPPRTERQDPTEVVRAPAPSPEPSAVETPPTPRVASWIAPLSASLVLAGLLVSAAMVYTHQDVAPRVNVPLGAALVVAYPDPAPPTPVVPTVAPAPRRPTVHARSRRHPAWGRVVSKRRRHRPASGHLIQARRAIQKHSLKDARRHALKALATDPGNTEAAGLVRDLNRRLKPY